MDHITFRAKRSLEHLPPRRPSYFQIATMIVNREPSHQSKLWRILEETRVRLADLDSARDQVADFYDQIEIMNCDIEDLRDQPVNSTNDETRLNAKIRMAQRRVDNSNMQIVKVREIMAAKQEELKFLLDTFDELSAIEAIKPWDDSAAQAEYWEKKLGTDIALRNALNLPPDLETIKAALALPDFIGLKKNLHESIIKAINQKAINANAGQ